MRLYCPISLLQIFLESFPYLFNFKSNNFCNSVNWSLLVSYCHELSERIQLVQGWTYGLDGALLKATRLTGIQKFEVNVCYKYMTVISFQSSRTLLSVKNWFLLLLHFLCVFFCFAMWRVGDGTHSIESGYLGSICASQFWCCCFSWTQIRDCLCGKWMAG